jgi:hypothetical protein
MPDFLINLASSQHIRNGLKAIPYIGAALTFADMFIAKEKKPMTMSINANIKLTGTITDYEEKRDFKVATPSSQDSELSEGRNYPLYNERLGVMNLLQTPRVKIKRMTTRWQSEMDWLENDMTNMGNAYENDWHNNHSWFNQGEKEHFYRRYNLQLLNMPEIVINPAAGFKMDNPDIMVALVVKKEYNIMGVPKDENGGLIEPRDVLTSFQTDMLPIHCANTNYSVIDFNADDVFRFWVDAYDFQNNPQLPYTLQIHDIDQVFHKDDRFYIKIFANLERVDNGERVLHVVEYPLYIVPSHYFTNTNKMEADDLHLTLENMTIKTNSNTDEFYQQTEALFVEYGANVVLDDKFFSDAEVNGYAGIRFKPGAHLERRQKIVFGNNAHFYTGGGDPCFSVPVNLANDQTAAFCSSSTYTENRIISKKLPGGKRHTSPGDLESLRFELMPNPTNGHTTIRWNSTEIADQSVWVTVVDISGTEVVSRQVSVIDEVVQFDLSGLPSGIYMVQLKTESGYTGIRKLVKQ